MCVHWWTCVSCGWVCMRVCKCACVTVRVCVRACELVFGRASASECLGGIVWLRARVVRSDRLLILTRLQAAELPPSPPLRPHDAGRRRGYHMLCVVTQSGSTTCGGGCQCGHWGKNTDVRTATVMWFRFRTHHMWTCILYTCTPTPPHNQIHIMHTPLNAHIKRTHPLQA